MKLRFILLISIPACMLFVSGINNLWADTLLVPEVYTTIQDAIDDAIQDDIISVASETYHENIVINGKQIAIQSRSGAEYTIIDGDQNDSVVRVIAGAVVTIEGFTIRNGYALKGGGIYGESSSPTIRNCKITENTATSTCDVCGGGGIYFNTCTSLIEDNQIFDNQSLGDGGGLIVIFGTAAISHNIVQNNQAENYVGGIYIRACEAEVERNKIIGNTAAIIGGFRNCDGSGYLWSNLIIGNTGNAGGGVSTRNTYMQIVNNTIVGNSSNEGGGIYIDHWSKLPTVIMNNIVSSNLSGGGMYRVANHSYNDVWNNTGGNYVSCSPDPSDISYNPEFIDEAGGDYHLENSSHCIATGNMTGDVPTEDLDGSPRPNPSITNPDMGAYESPLPEVIAISVLSPNGAEKLKGGNVYIITWGTMGGGIDHIKLLYSTDGGGTYPNTIIGNTTDDGGYGWTTPSINSSTVRIKAMAMDSGNTELASDTSDGSFAIDSTAPVTTHSLSGTLGTNGWYTTNVEVTLNATDNLSGVKNTKYKINEGSWQVYSTPFTVTGTIVKYYSEDNAGNIETEKQVEINIDKTAPSVPVVTDDGSCTTDGSQLHTSWTSSDGESDIAEYQYAIGTTSGGTNVVNWTSTGTTASVTKTGLNLTQGQVYYISVKAKNGAGSWSSVGTSDGIMYQLPVITATPASLTFDAVAGGSNPANKTLNISNTGCGTLNWSVSDSASWLSCLPTSGDCTSETDDVTVSVDISGLSAGTHNSNITVSAASASNTPL